MSVSEADYERALFEAEAEAAKLRSRRARWHKIRSYLPGSAPKDKWGEPSVVVYYHKAHICMGEFLAR